MRQVFPKIKAPYLLFCTSCFFYFFLVFNFGFSNWLVILKLCLILLPQVLAGMLIFSLSKLSKAMSFINFIIVSFVVGTSVNLIIHGFFKEHSVKVLAYTAVAIPIILGVPRLIDRMKSESFCLKVNKTSIFAFLSILGIIQLQILSWEKINPIFWQGWWKFHIDIAFYESLSNSLEAIGPNGSAMDVNGEIKYHWFAYSLIGQLNSLSAAEPFFVLTRFYPVLFLFVSAISMFGFSSIFLKRLELRYLAVIVLLLGPGLSIGSLVPIWSPSSMLSIPYCIGFFIYLNNLLQIERYSKVDFLLLPIFALALVGSKSTSAAVISLSLAMTAAHLFSRNGRASHSKILLLFSMSLLIIISFLGLIWTNESRSLGFGLFLGWPGLLATSLGLFLGVVFVVVKKDIKDSELAFLYIAFFGAILSLITRDVFGNQLYFFFIGILAVIPLSLRWLSDFQFVIVREISFSRIWFFISVLFSVLPVIVWRNFENRIGLIGDIGRSLAPFLLIIGALASFAFFQMRMLLLTKKDKSIVLMSVLLMMTILSSSLMTISEYVFGPKYSNTVGVTKIGLAAEREPGAINYDYVLAGKWVALNIEKDAMGFTSRQCFDSVSQKNSCDTRWFFASALSKRSLLVEGSAYSSGEAGKKRNLSRNEVLSIDFARNPNMDNLKELLAKGVTWGWIDKNSTQLRSWSPYAEILYENPQVMIILLQK